MTETVLPETEGLKSAYLRSRRRKLLCLAVLAGLMGLCFVADILIGSQGLGLDAFLKGLLGTEISRESVIVWQIRMPGAVMALLVGTHFAEEAVFPEVGPDGRLPRSWAEHAVATSVDWSPDSRFVHFFTGGFNTHVTHHLFPNTCHLHYREIDPLVKAAARRHGLPVAATNLAGLVASHWRFLERLSRGPGDPGKVPLGRRPGVTLPAPKHKTASLGAS